MHGIRKTWTEAELKEMGFHKIVIGVPGRPLPVMVPNPTATTKEDAYRLEAMEDEKNPIIIWSRRPYAEVIGILYRFLPTPSMLPLFYETLQLLQVENDRRIQFYIGKHGSGKSFLGRLIGDYLHPEGAIAINCADRDMNELLFETVLDVQANPSLYSQINDRLREGSLNQTSVSALKAVVGEAYVQKDGAPFIDFEKIGSFDLRTITDADGLTATEAVDVGAETKEVVETLLRISRVEGLQKEASFMPLKSQMGLLPRIWQDGRVAHLEEYNKCKEGTDTALHPVLQVFNGENTKCRVYGSGGMSFAFDNRERHPGFFCYLDGNMQQDGVATHMLSASANDRILPIIIQDMRKEDWQHRWCQMLTGIPIKLLYESKREQWDADPESFTNFLHMIRGLGDTEVPEAHTHYINRWEDVLDATDIIARYNNLYDEMTNPDSAANKEGKYPELFTEVDDEYYNMAGGSMRRNIYYFKMAMLGRPATQPQHLSQGYDLSIDWAAPPDVSATKDNYQPEAKLGTNIVEIFYRDMVRLTLGVGKVNLFTRLKVAFESLRMMRPPLSEGASMDAVYLEDLLNSEVADSNRSNQIQKLFCRHLRERFPNTPMSKNDDDLMTVGQIDKALMKAATRTERASDDARLRFLFSQQFSPLVTVDNLIYEVALIDSLMTRAGRQVQLREEDLMDHDHFLSSLALPRLGKANFKALFTNTLITESESPLAEDDEALRICCNTSATGLALTTVLTKQQVGGITKSAPVHLLYDADNDKMLAVGELVTDQLQGFLKDSDVEYVDRDASNARPRIQTFLNRVLMKSAPETESFLIAAFFHRNILSGMDLLRDIDKLDRMRLAELLADPAVVARRPLYATQLAEHKKIVAYLEQAAAELEMG